MGRNKGGEPVDYSRVKPDWCRKTLRHDYNVVD